MKLRPYPEYRDSGVAWLEKVPKHWQVLPNRALFSEVNERNHPNEQLLSVTISRGVIRQTELLTNSSKKDLSNENKANYKLVQPDDIAYNKMRAWQGAAGVSKYRGIVIPAYIVVRPRGKQNSEYFHYLLRIPAFAKEAERWSYGITSDQWSLRAEDFKRIYCLLPPKKEQDSIVIFLAHFDRRINRLIRAKRRLIELLNEQQQAIIHEAVTRGFDSNVRLKPSGIDWLGDVPEHWKALKLKYLVETRGGMTPSKAEVAYWDGDIPWVSPKDMKVSELSDSLDHIAHRALNETSITLIDPPAVLIVVRGMILARTFPVAVTTRQVTINQDMKDLIPYPALDAWFLSCLLTGLEHHILTCVEESGQGTRCLRSEVWQNMTVPVPPYREQREIVGALDLEFTSMNTAIDRARSDIDLLREYRIRLIADVVTGKLDVRSVELPALDATEALDDLDNDEEAVLEEMDATEEMADVTW